MAISLGKAVWLGLTSGLLTMLGVTMIFVPMSYFMNKSAVAHDNWLMRFMPGLLAGILFIFAWPIMFFSQKIEYGGLLPLFEYTPLGDAEGWASSALMYVWNLFRSPFMFKMTEPDRIALLLGMYGSGSVSPATA